ncbi:hypothetical protein C8250_042185 [Streptomyces sp. So13.3]|nr:hypothetical protein C8250_042185 [Streptomyces sp. So13.3]
MRMAFPVFARGVIPIPGAKSAAQPLGIPVRCGGVDVHPSDVVVADEEVMVVVPAARRDENLGAARAKLAKEAGEFLDVWEGAHRARIEKAIGERMDMPRQDD